MKIKALRTLVGAYGRALPGETIDVTDKVGEQLIRKGVAAPFSATPKSAKGSKRKAAGGGSRKPKGSRSGGQGGKAKPSSSSEADQAPAGTTSPASEPASG